MGKSHVGDLLRKIAQQVQAGFKEERRILSFGEYLELFAKHPQQYSRDAVQYLRDTFDHYGEYQVDKPWGAQTRFKLFDLPWLQGQAAREGLIGQEAVQAEVYRALANFVREGRANRLPLLHGPNGSAKSTVVRCIVQALEHYSTLEVGALYRFHWVFPNMNVLRGAIGFGGKPGSKPASSESYAHLKDEQMDARLFMEIRDHPLFLLPPAQRAELIVDLLQSAGKPAAQLSQWMLRGQLSHKNRQIFEALLASYDGQLDEVLRHVQVERYFISRRYRVGAVTVGPQLSVDAGERQVTADRSLGALPSSLKALSLFEAHGELIEASGGVLEFSDLLKRPLDAFKYLQHTVETGEVTLSSQNVNVNCVMLASANEVQLEAFRQHHEFESFRGRLELIRTGYLRSWVDEQAIYDGQIVPQIRRHVAPHATRVAAMFSVLTRMRTPNPERYTKATRDVVSTLTAMEKMDLYGTGLVPSRLDEESARLVRTAIPEIYQESDIYAIYEGSMGASPREMRTVLLDAAQNPLYECLSPFAVLDELDSLCERTGEYAWLQEEPREGGYHDHEKARQQLRVRLTDVIESEFRAATGLVDDNRARELFERYIQHVSHWAKGEKIRNPHTGSYDEPDQRLMEEVEALLKSPDEAQHLRHSLLNTIAAWAIDHPDRELDIPAVFAEPIRRMQQEVFAERRGAVAKLVHDVMVVLHDADAKLEVGRKQEALAVVERLKKRYAYEESSAADAAAVLIRERFADLLV
jgi:predicted Ser/Thr protein kinase